ncbi:MAG TPA: hypothetical protein VFO26_05705 [Gaiella sp.]|uniref:hypothetical protein n=1 Tax=Gaiella sp. TaxID=2663207 RepID=UPI002D7FBF26|nr:hypothetical protein [Gaiella sp.]HET9287034.1 hypothetical protein [Gaiella sp.]
MTSVTTPSDARELAFRATDGVEVTLLWHQHNDYVSVTVFDSKTGERFELVLDDGESAMDVFHHPYAHAARRGLDYHLRSGEYELAAA